MVPEYLRLTTDLDPAEVDRLAAEAAAGGTGARDAKRRLAREVVTLYHGPEAATAAEAAFDAGVRLRAGGAATPESATPLPIPEGAVRDGQVWVVALLADAGLVASRGEARRLVTQGGPARRPAGRLRSSRAGPRPSCTGACSPWAGARRSSCGRPGPDPPRPGPRLPRNTATVVGLVAALEPLWLLGYRRRRQVDTLSQPVLPSPGCKQGSSSVRGPLRNDAHGVGIEGRRSPSAKRIRSDGCSVAVLTPSRSGRRAALLCEGDDVAGGAPPGVR